MELFQKGLDAINDDEGPGEDPEVIAVIDGEAGPLNGELLLLIRSLCRMGLLI